MNLLCANGALNGGDSRALLSHVPAPSATTCMSSLEAAAHPLRAEGKLDEPTNGGSLAALARACASSCDMSKRL